jgi:hypothetical protein
MPPTDYTKLFSDCSPAVLGFISRLSRENPPPPFPTIIGTGFFADASGLAVTNRHVIESLNEVPAHPNTGAPAEAAVVFFPGEDGLSWQMLVLEIVLAASLGEFTSKDTWYGQTIPDIGFVQLAVRDVPVLKLATESSYLKIGMDIAHRISDGQFTSHRPRKIESGEPVYSTWDSEQPFPFPVPIPTRIHHGYNATGWIEWFTRVASIRWACGRNDERRRDRN